MLTRKGLEAQPQQELRVIIDDLGNPWFVAKDVCEVLELVNITRALSGLDDDEKGFHTVNTPGGPQKMTIINESGLYSLILRSRKPEAKRFKKWVTSEVLPTIRKTGGYIPTQPEDDDVTVLAKAVLIANAVTRHQREPRPAVSPARGFVPCLCLLSGGYLSFNH